MRVIVDARLPLKLAKIIFLEISSRSTILSQPIHIVLSLVVYGKSFQNVIVVNLYSSPALL